MLVAISFALLLVVVLRRCDRYVANCVSCFHFCDDLLIYFAGDQSSAEGHVTLNDESENDLVVVQLQRDLTANVCREPCLHFPMAGTVCFYQNYAKHECRASCCAQVPLGEIKLSCFPVVRNGFVHESVEIDCFDAHDLHFDDRQYG